MQKCTLIGVYSKHLCTVLCGMFSPLDPDIVFTGSADHSIHSWRISKDLQNEIIEFKSKLIHLFKDYVHLKFYCIILL